MKDLDLDAPRIDVLGSGKVSNSKHKEAQKLNATWNIIQAKLKNIYFFTEQQLDDVFHMNAESDILLFDQIINDVEEEYQTIHVDVSINEHLYTALTSIETKTSVTLDEGIYRDVLNNIEEYIGNNAQMIQYDYFRSLRETDIGENIKTYIHNCVQDFFVIHIDQDINLSDEEKNTLPKRIKHFLSYSESRGINFYTFVQKDGKIKFAPGIFGGTTGRANDTYFGDIIKERNAQKIDISLSSLVSLL